MFGLLILNFLVVIIVFILVWIKWGVVCKIGLRGKLCFLVIINSLVGGKNLVKLCSSFVCFVLIGLILWRGVYCIVVCLIFKIWFNCWGEIFFWS